MDLLSTKRYVVFLQHINISMSNISSLNNGLGVSDLKHKHQLTSFVETGCYQGDSLMFAKDIGFDKLYSCDIDNNCVIKCQALIPNSKITNLESISFFKEILPTLTEKTFFWLDAHFPAYYGLPENETTKFPLIEELKLIKSLKHNYQHDVIMCDDIRILLPDGNPYHLGHIWDMFKVNHTIKELTDVLEDTHNFYTLTKCPSEGVLVLVPK